MEKPCQPTPTHQNHIPSHMVGLRRAIAARLADLARLNQGLSPLEMAEALGDVQRELVKRHLRTVLP